MGGVITLANVLDLADGFSFVLFLKISLAIAWQTRGRKGGGYLDTNSAALCRGVGRHVAFNACGWLVIWKRKDR